MKISEIINESREENFKRWFGNSKVVDGSGKPLVVYHGTGSDFKSFDGNKIGKNFDSSTLGFYFTNAASADFERGFGFGSTASEYAQNSGGVPHVMPVYLNIKNPLILDDSAEWGGSVLALDKRRGDIKRWLKNGNHDGIIVYDATGEDNERIFVVFHPNQIKSATGNNGEFDPNNPDITKE